jgi:superfamily II DNA/RNA helicase
MYSLRIPPLDDYVPLQSSTLSHSSGHPARGEVDPLLYPSIDERWEYRPFVRMRKRMENLVPKVKRLASGIHKPQQTVDDIDISNLSAITQDETFALDDITFEPFEVEEEYPSKSEEKQDEEKQDKEEKQDQEMTMSAHSYKYFGLPGKPRITKSTMNRFKQIADEIAEEHNLSNSIEKEELLQQLVIDYIFLQKVAPIEGIHIVPSKLNKKSICELYKKIGEKLKLNPSQTMMIPKLFYYELLKSWVPKHIEDPDTYRNEVINVVRNILESLF